MATPEAILLGLQEMHIVSPVLFRALFRDVLLFGDCAVEVVDLGCGVRRRSRVDITRLSFDEVKGVAHEL